jgi:adenosylhomocysteine nucleosidase
MYEVAIFVALGWERRAVTGALAGVEAAGRPRTWRARLVDGTSCLVVQTGVGPERAARVAADAPPARRFLACGCAGALGADVGVGDLVVADALTLVDAGGATTERFEADAEWLVPLGARLGGLVTSPVVLATRVTKAAAGRGGALAVDMESAAVARVARVRGIPFSALRVIVDAVDDELPFGPDLVDGASGEVHAGRALATIGPRPWLWRLAARLARQTRLAEQRLALAVASLRGAAPPSALAV